MKAAPDSTSASSVHGVNLFGLRTPRPGPTTDVAPCNAPCPALRPDLVAPELGLVNQHRATVGGLAVVIDPNLQACAEWKALNMAAGLYMDHNDHWLVERTVAQRFAVYYPSGSAGWGENIAYGFLDATTVLQAFLSDVGHKANVENTSWQGVGLACAQVPADASQGAGLLFWVQDYGTAPVGPVPAPPTITAIAPTSGTVGAKVGITGTNFVQDAIRDVVFASNVRATYSWENATHITASVPPGAVSGPLIVSTTGGFADSPTFTVGATPQPPSPPPDATCLQRWVTLALPHLQKMTGTWKSWHRLQPAEYNAVQAWLADPSLPLPAVTSEYGQFVVQTLAVLNTCG